MIEKPMALVNGGLIRDAQKVGEHDMSSADEKTRVPVLEDVAISQIFKRRAIKRVGTPEAYAVEWVVVELLDGTRIYAEGGRVCITRHDLNP